VYKTDKLLSGGSWLGLSDTFESQSVSRCRLKLCRASSDYNPNGLRGRFVRQQRRRRRRWSADKRRDEKGWGWETKTSRRRSSSSGRGIHKALSLKCGCSVVVVVQVHFVVKRPRQTSRGSQLIAEDQLRGAINAASGADEQLWSTTTVLRICKYSVRFQSAKNSVCRTITSWKIYSAWSTGEDRCSIMHRISKRKRASPGHVLASDNHLSQLPTVRNCVGKDIWVSIHRSDRKYLRYFELKHV